jgi:hypothetical protein
MPSAAGGNALNKTVTPALHELNRQPQIGVLDPTLLLKRGFVTCVPGDCETDYRLDKRKPSYRVLLFLVKSKLSLYLASLLRCLGMKHREFLVLAPLGTA